VVAAGAAIALLTTGAGLAALPAQAAPGDHSNATGQYLRGSLLGLDAALVASLGGEAAASTGTTAQTNANNLDVGVLGLVNLTAPGGVQLPIDLGSVGVVGQYASALPDASSVGASGLTSATGDIGTGITPAPGVAPGPLRLSLAQAVSSLGLPTATLNELAQLELTVGVTAARAAQTAPGAPSGGYSLGDVGVRFQSPTVAGVAGVVNTRVAAVQSAVDALAGPSGTLATALDALPIGGVLSTAAAVDSSALPAAVAPLLTGPITDPAYPGVTIDLGTGTVTVDLAQLTGLEGLAPNTDLLTAPVIAELGDRITGVLGSLVTRVQSALTTAVDALHVTATTSLLGAPVITIDSTLGQLLHGDTSGISLLGAGALLPLSSVTAALLTPLNTLGPAISAIGPAVLTPVADAVIPALDPVLSGVLSLTANNQATSGGVFTETALRATVLPATSALTLEVANASVGPNALAGPPTATGITPTSGPQNGGTAVTITGSGFTGATGVTFGGTAGTAFTVVDDSTITATTPAHTPGAVDVVVQHPSGDAAPLTFTFLPTPTIASVTPNSGPETGGTAVTITGTGFTGATGVTFGGTAAPSFTVVDDTSITTTTPAHAPGAVGVVVTAPGGQSAPGDFTFLSLPAPVITGLAPDHGPQTGGTTVTISGTGLTGATGATFGCSPGSAFTVVNDTTATVTSPAHAPGTVDVVVQHPNGASAPAPFTFDPVAGAPAITGLAPDHGPFTGGTVVTISGSGFTGATGVTVGGVSVPFTVVGDGTITITTPPHAPGAVPIVVTTPVGATPPASFVYDPGTTVDGVTPGSGPAAGGTTVTVTGGCFTGATSVLFGTTPAASFTVVDDHTIRAVTPAGTGTVDVTVVGAAACGSGTLPGGFHYVDPIAGGGTTPAGTATGATTGSGSGGSGSLASTGSDAGAATMLGGLALLLLAAGVLLVVRRTRRA
jgi:LPXTG-motif cell wall-anchored protein